VKVGEIVPLKALTDPPTGGERHGVQAGYGAISAKARRIRKLPFVL